MPISHFSIFIEKLTPKKTIRPTSTQNKPKKSKQSPLAYFHARHGVPLLSQVAPSRWVPNFSTSTNVSFKSCSGVPHCRCHCPCGWLWNNISTIFSANHNQSMQTQTTQGSSASASEHKCTSIQHRGPNQSSCQGDSTTSHQNKRSDNT